MQQSSEGFLDSQFPVPVRCAGQGEARAHFPGEPGERVYRAARPGALGIQDYGSCCPPLRPQPLMRSSSSREKYRCWLYVRISQWGHRVSVRTRRWSHARIPAASRGSDEHGSLRRQRPTPLRRFPAQPGTRTWMVLETQWWNQNSRPFF